MSRERPRSQGWRPAATLTLPSRKIARAGGARFFRELMALGLADRTRTTGGVSLGSGEGRDRAWGLCQAREAGRYVMIEWAVHDGVGRMLR